MIFTCIVVGVALRGHPFLLGRKGWPRRATPTTNSLRDNLEADLVGLDHRAIATGETTLNRELVLTGR